MVEFANLNGKAMTMVKRRLTRRILSTILAAAMMTPPLATVAEAMTTTWLSPKPGQPIVARQVEVSVGYNTESSLKVTRLELWIDGKFHEKKVLIRPESRGVASFGWDTSRATQGSHDLQVRIFAGNELVATVSGTGSVGRGGYDLRPPTVRFSNVKSGDVLKGTAKIALDASDDSGEPPMVSLLVDSALRMLTNRTPYQCDLDTTQYADGSHELQGVAFDKAGNKSDPAVVKVAFRNNVERPVVATMNISPQPAMTAPSEDDGVGETVPPAASAKDRPEAARSVARESLPKASAARPVATPEPALRTTKPMASTGHAAVPNSAASPAASASPRATDAKLATPSATRNAVAPARAAASKPIAPKEPAPAREVPVTSRVEPALVASATSPQQLRPGTKDHTHSAQPAEPRELVVRTAPREAASQPMPLASVPRNRPGELQAVLGSGAIAEPVNREPAEDATPDSIAVALEAVARAPEFAAQPSPGNATTPAAVGDPVASDASDVVSVATAPTVRDVHTKTSAGIAPREPLSSGSKPALAASPKPVRTAMLPVVRGSDLAGPGQGTIAAPPAPKRETRAKLEKKMIPVSGKVKLRDFFEQLGGVLFWDSATHTVTGYLDGMMLEMQIGSRSMKVNGVEMNAEKAPFLVEGRTIVDASTLHRACALAARAQARAD